MDLKKIGIYIAGKRKEAGMTQKQLAGKLGMSDKSVSKWERGICLPDVSVYMELCDILGISINEFLAGEDIAAENVVRQSEENLIVVTRDGDRKQKSLKSILVVMWIIVIAMAVVLGGILFHRVNRPHNYIEPADRDSVEMKTVELLSGEMDAGLFRYLLRDQYESMTLYMSEYQNGKLVSKDKIAEITDVDSETESDGMLVFVPDFEHFVIKVIITDSSAKYSTEIPILEGVKGREYYARSTVSIQDLTSIQYNKELDLVAFLYGENELQMIPVKEIRNADAGMHNDYEYCFSIEFEEK